MFKKFELTLTVVENIKLNNSFFKLVLTHSEPLPEMVPGQFVEVKVENTPTVYLRRPISINNVDYKANTLSLVIKNVGDGTNALSTLSVGSTVNILLPLGNGYTLINSGEALLVGGGVGIAPLLYLGKVLRSGGVKVTYLLGFKVKSDLIDLSDYEALGDVMVTTEDGSVGVKGFVTGHQCIKRHYDMMYVCGPTPMMRNVAKEAMATGTECEVSLENMMACGLGACLGCVTQTKEGHKCVCSDGPVFNINKLILSE
ncbi:MAG: dihydroorotate dehydrogenase electron transfer subunit [Paludibacteraceae bacterium]|nr:dihydroorotate dehydrogenase electron transfer subunit [Paludibacteraceae bacterium]